MRELASPSTRPPRAASALPFNAASGSRLAAPLQWWLTRWMLTFAAGAAIAAAGWPLDALGADHGDAHAAPAAAEHGSEPPAAARKKPRKGAAEPAPADDHEDGTGGKAADKPVDKAGDRRAQGIVPPLPRAEPSLNDMERLRDTLNAKIAEVRAAQAAADAKAAETRRQANRNVVRAVYSEHAPQAVALRGARAGQTAATAATKPAAAAGHGGDHHIHWSYGGETGPQSWGRLKPEFATCDSGRRQSPIDIREGIAVDLAPIGFDYHPSGFGVIDNGHTVQVNLERGNAITVLGRRYELVQFHFHRPSEERINGRQFEMVAHLVHKDPEGRLAVVAVLLQAGPAHPIVQQVWNNLPLEKGEELRAPAQIDLNALLPADRGYYTYMGSLTTPPCSEGVLWMVMKQPVPVSAEQVGIFARLYPMNARPIQSSSGRLIKESAAAGVR